ncbi:pilus assembly protein [Ralstonia sp. A12]|uniref:GspH/FimT family pseudopilin n=1 Tax=Ralstonia sp. A12 TaxID=1217052 RepID=UPI000573D07B|nr:GspH/FimT family pseudopilin [Ralstonia sp. A12]KHK56139.1 pilus assembly protein [Ralstonia sp. A12]
MKYRRSRAGFTLAELIVVLSVMSILAVFAVPAGLDWWRRETVVTLADQVVSSITLAQTLSRNQRIWVQIGPRDTNQDWSSGWAVYITAKPQTQITPFKPSGGDLLITVSQPVSSSIKITFDGSRREVKTLSYSPVGYSRYKTSQFYGTLTIASGAHIRRVKIDSTGRARVCNPDKDKTCTGSAADNDEP